MRLRKKLRKRKDGEDVAVRETHILIDVLANADPLRDMNNAIDDTIRSTRKIDPVPFQQMNDEMYRGSKYSRKLKEDYFGLTEESRRMNQEMRYGWQRQNKEFLKFKNQMIAAKYGYFQLAKASDHYDGSTKDLMKDVKKLGKAHKDATDNMINQNKKVLMSMYKQAGTFMNLTTQSKRIADNYDRMNNPLLLVNKNALKAADSMNRLANRGNAAVLALSMLGPTASIKQLRDMTQMINQGLTRFAMVAIGAAISSYLLYKGMHKLAMENERYEESFTRMVGNLRKAIQPMVDAFVAIMVPIYNFINAMALLIIKFEEAHPVISRIIGGILLLIPALTLLLSPLAIGVGLVAGFAAAWSFLWTFIGPLITGIAAMSSSIWLLAAALVVGVYAINRLWKESEKFRDVVTGAFDAAKNAIKDFFEFISPAIDFVIDKLKILGEAIKSAFEGDFSKLGEIFKSLIPTIIGFILGGIPGLIIAGARFIPAIIQGIQSNSGNLVAKIQEITNNVVSFLQNDLPKYITIGVSMLEKLIQGITQAIPQFVQVIQNVINTVLPLIIQLLPVLINAGIQILMALITGILQALPALLNAVVTLLTSLVNMIIQNAPIIIQAGMTILQTLLDGILLNMPLIITGMLQLITQIANALTVNMPIIIQAGVQVLTALMQGITTMIPLIVQLMIEILNQLVATLTANMPMLIQTGTQIITALIDGIVQNLPLIIAAIVELVIALGQAVIDNLPLIISAGGEITTALRKGIIDLVGELLGAVKSSVIDPLVAKFKEIDLVQVGKDIMNGLIEGIVSMGNQAVKIAEGIASDIGGAVKGFFGIASPSKLMIEYGGFVTEGLGKGIADGTDYVQRMAMDMNLAAVPMTYSPDTQTGGNTISNNNSSVVNVKIEVKSGNGEETSGVKQQVKEAMNEVFEYLNVLYEPEGEY